MDPSPETAHRHPRSHTDSYQKTSIIAFSRRRRLLSDAVELQDAASRSGTRKCIERVDDDQLEEEVRVEQFARQLSDEE